MPILQELKEYDFNDSTGYLSVIFVCIAVSLVFVSLAYLSEGIGWIGDETHSWVGWNWLKGAGIAVVVAGVLLGIAITLLNSNAGRQERKQPLFGKLDLNGKKGLLGLASLSVSAVFFFNGITYRQEAARWYYAGVAQGINWFFNEASAWTTSAAIMLFIGIALSAAGWILIALEWKRGSSQSV